VSKDDFYDLVSKTVKVFATNAPYIPDRLLKRVNPDPTEARYWKADRRSWLRRCSSTATLVTSRTLH